MINANILRLQRDPFRYHFGQLFLELFNSLKIVLFMNEEKVFYVYNADGCTSKKKCDSSRAFNQRIEMIRTNNRNIGDFLEELCYKLYCSTVLDQL